MRKPAKPNRPKGYEEPKFNEKTGVWLFQKSIDSKINLEKLSNHERHDLHPKQMLLLEWLIQAPSEDRKIFNTWNFSFLTCLYGHYKNLLMGIQHE